MSITNTTMTRVFSKAICALLAVCLLLSVIPAAKGADAASGTQQPILNAVSPVGKPGVAVSGTAEEVQAFFEKNNRTDGLPIVPPTEERCRTICAIRPTPPPTSS